MIAKFIMNNKVKFIIIVVSLYALLTLLVVSPSLLKAKISKSIIFPSVHQYEITENYTSVKIDKFKSNTCKTFDVVYTKVELSKIFSYRNYKECIPSSNDLISFKNQNLSVVCMGNSKPQYAVDANENEVYGNNKKTLPNWSRSLPDFKDKQFLLVKCSVRSVFAFVFNRFKKEVSEAANEIRMRLVSDKKNMNVLLMVFDSISKFSFKRNLPKTSKFLEDIGINNQLSKQFSVYNFEKATVAESRTRWNMAQILYGKTWEEAEFVFGKNPDINLAEKQKLDYQKHAIWSHYSSLGYVTMFSHNTGLSFLSLLTGNTIKADHVFANFWNHIWGVLNKHDIVNGQKCIGDRNAHDFSFDYTYQFFENYKENNKFAYIHSNAAHEHTGNVITIDDDLLKFLENFLTMIQSRGDNLALFLISDHGHKQKNAPEWDIRTLFDVITPTTYLIMTKDIVKKLKAEEILKYNEKQLISRFDINLSLKHLAYAPYNISVDSWYPKAKFEYNNYKTISLFEETPAFDRTCSDIGVEKEFCICSWFEPVENNYREKVIRNQMITLFAKYLKKIGKSNLYCNVRDRVEVAKSESLILKSLEKGLFTVYKIELKTVNNIVISIDFNFCLMSALKKNKYKVVTDKLKPHSIFDISKVTGFLQLQKITLPSECISDFCSC